MANALNRRAGGASTPATANALAWKAADPGRRTLMSALYRSPEPIDCAILVERTGLGLSNPTISHHYRVLREAGLTRTTVEARKRVVRVRRDDIESRFPGLLDAVLATPDRAVVSG